VRPDGTWWPSSNNVGSSVFGVVSGGVVSCGAQSDMRREQRLGLGTGEEWLLSSSNDAGSGVVGVVPDGPHLYERRG